MKTTASNKEKALYDILMSDFKDGKELGLVKRNFAKKYSIAIPSNSELIRIYKELVSRNTIKKDELKEKIFRRRAVRTMSGIAPVAVLTKPYACPGACAYCPSEKDVPQSYLSNEPAVMRAIRCAYDPYIQVQDRLKALEANGHEPTKIELIVIGGTWSVLPNKYKYWYIANLFKGANDYGSRKTQNITHNTKISDLEKILILEQKKNEKAKYKIIGLTLETRPDYINGPELLEMREFGCTRVELGVQAVDDNILKLNKRGHGVQAVVDATKLLKDYGFKVTYHIMPALPGSNPNKDLEMFKMLFSDERFQPDQIKFYPTVVTKGSLLYRWWKAGKYKPYSNKQLEDLIIKCKKVVPEYVRIIRLIRDIPGESIEAGNMITNLRQVMQSRGVECRCIRCREVKNSECRIQNAELNMIKYNSSGGSEYFLSYDSKDGKSLYGFCRLRISDMKHEALSIKQEAGNMKSASRQARQEGNNTSAMIRELHVYGELVSVGAEKKVQHSGLGKKLLQEAEKIARACGCKEISVISGVGVRNYYRKNRYRMSGTYMKKSLTK